MIYGLVQGPVPLLRVFVFFSFKEHNFAWGSGHESFIVDQIHLSKVFVSYFFKLYFKILVDVVEVNWNSESLTLSVEWIYLIQSVIVKALVREIYFGTFENLIILPVNRSLADLVEKVIVS